MNSWAPHPPRHPRAILIGMPWRYLTASRWILPIESLPCEVMNDETLWGPAVMNITQPAEHCK